MRELNFATLRTAVKLFDKLDLQPEKGQQEEPGHNVARLFIRYSSFLFKMLHRLDPMVGSYVCMSSNFDPNIFLQMLDDGLSEQTSYSQVSTTTTQESTILTSQKSKMPNKDTDLRELIINGLASLISANTEFGIKHCLPMTYDADPAQCVIFAHVFARVVAKGLRFDPQKEQPTSAKLDKLVEVCVYVSFHTALLTTGIDDQKRRGQSTTISCSLALPILRFYTRLS